MAIELATAYVSIVPSTDKLESGIKTALNRAERDLKITPTVDAHRMSAGFSQAGRTSSESFLGAFKTYTQQGMSPVGTAIGLTVGRTIGAGIQANRAVFHAAGQMIANTLKGALIGGVVGVGAVVTATLFKGFQRLESLDRARHQLEALGQSAEDIKKIMADVNDVVTGTPIALNEAMAEVPKLLAANVKDIKGFITAVGDAAGFTGDAFGDIADGFNQVLNQGKLTKEEIQNQFRKLPVENWLAKSMGTDPASISKMISDGKIGIQQLMDAVESNAGGFAKKMGDTIEGALANMQVALARTGANLIAAIFGGDAVTASDNMVGALKAISGKFDELSNWITAHRDEIHNFFVQAGDAIKNVATKLGEVAHWLTDNIPGGIGTVVKAFVAWEAITGVASLLSSLKAVGAALGVIQASSAAATISNVGTAATGALGTAGVAGIGGSGLLGFGAALMAIVGAWGVFATLGSQALQPQYPPGYNPETGRFQSWEPVPQSTPEMLGGLLGATPQPGQPGFIGPVPAKPVNPPATPGAGINPFGPGGALSATPTSGGGGQSYPGNPQQAVPAAMLQSGFPESEWSALNSLINGESGWRPTVRNASGAYGLFQFLGHEGDKYGALGGYSSDPATQAVAGLAYIKDRYGSPSNAWAFWQSQSPHWYSSGGGVGGFGRGDTIPALLEPGEHVFSRGDVAALGGQAGVYALRQAIHMQTGGEVPNIPDWVKQAATAAGISPQEYLAGLTLSATTGVGPPPGLQPHPGSAAAPGPAQSTGEPTQDVQSALSDSFRMPGLEPTTTGTVGIAGTSFIAKALNLPNEFIGFLIDTGAEIAQTAISAAISTGVAAGAGGATFGAGAAAAPLAGAAASQAAGFGLKIAASEAKRLTSYGFQMASIGIDSVIENLFSPIGGAPRWMGYDYTQFIPSMAMQAAQLGVTTGEKAINEAITRGLSGQQPGGAAGGPVQPGQMPGMEQTTGPTPAFGQAPPPPSAPPEAATHLGAGAAPGPLAPSPPAAAPSGPPAPAPTQQNPVDWLTNLFGFDQGGWLMPGATGINLTARPEPVLSAEQWDVMSKPGAAQKGYGTYIANVTVSDVEEMRRELSKRDRLAAMRYSGRP